MASLKKIVLASRRPMQSGLSLALWRVAIEEIDEPQMRSRLLNQLRARDDEEIAKGGWFGVIRGWRNRASVNPVDLVQGLPEELLFAVVRFKLADSADSYLARLFLAGGRLSEMEFNKPIKLERQKQRPSWTEVELKGGDPGPMRGERSFLGPVARLASNYEVSGVGPALSAEDERMLLGGSDFQLPAEYVEVLREANGFEVGALVIYSLDATQTVEDRGCKYLVIGTGGEDRFLVVKQDRPNLLCVDHEFTKVQDLGTSFISGVEKLLRRSAK